jgi:hypothetical protein
MVDLGEIQATYYMVAATGVLVAAIYYVYNMRVAQRMAKANQESRRVELTNNILHDLLSEQSWNNFAEMMNMQWIDFEDFTKKYDSSVNPQNFAKRSSYMSVLDNLGYLYKNKIIDSETMYEAGGIQSIWIYAKFKPIIDEYRRVSWGNDRMMNFDYLAREMYKIQMVKDPLFKGDFFYFNKDDLKRAFSEEHRSQ